MSELEQKLIEYMDKTAGAIEKVAELSIDQAPLIVKEYITWGIISGIYSFATYCIMIVFACVGFRVLWTTTKHEPRGLWDDGLGSDLCRCLGGVLLAICIWVSAHSAFCHLEPAIKAYTAPRAYVIDKLRGAK